MHPWWCRIAAIHSRMTIFLRRERVGQARSMRNPSKTWNIAPLLSPVFGNPKVAQQKMAALKTPGCRGYELWNNQKTTKRSFVNSGPVNRSVCKRWIAIIPFFENFENITQKTWLAEAIYEFHWIPPVLCLWIRTWTSQRDSDVRWSQQRR